MVATQQVREKYGMRPNKEWLAGLTHRKQWLCLCQGFEVSKQTPTPQTSEHPSPIESTVGTDLTNRSTNSN
jgi:hypothetical protein